MGPERLRSCPQRPWHFQTLLLLVSVSAGYELLDPLEVCNGSPKLCHLALDQVTLAGHHNAEAHNLMVKGMHLECATDNHKHDILGALSSGMRFFDIDTCVMDAAGGHSSSQTIRNCHGPAVGRTLAEILADVEQWLKHPDNQREVVAISFNEAIPEEDSREKKDDMLRTMVPIVEKHLGEYMLRPDDKPRDTWPTLGTMVKQNKRIVVLWGRMLWFAMFSIDKEDPNSGYMKQYLRSEDTWTNMWKGEYSEWDVEELKEYMVSYCEKSYSTQPLVIADAYLGIGNRGDKFNSFCNEDLAFEVNPEVLTNDHPSDSPLIEMQKRCWNKGRHVSMVMMDYAAQFGVHLGTMALAMNERNFARYGWVGGVAELGPKLSNFRGDGKEAESKDLSEDDFRDLLALAGSVKPARISIDAVEQLSRSWRVYFTVRATAGKALAETPNRAVLASLKASVARGGVGGVRAVRAECGDPGHPVHGVRVPDAELGFLEGAVVTYTCDFGYAAYGHVRRTCGDDGLFTGLQPMCELEILHRWKRTPLWAKITGGAALVATLACLAAVCPKLYRCLKRCVQMEAFRIVFSELDHTGSGLLHKDELAMALDRMDAKPDGQVDFDEFMDAMRRERAASQDETTLARQLQRADREQHQERMSARCMKAEAEQGHVPRSTSMPVGQTSPRVKTQATF